MKDLTHDWNRPIFQIEESEDTGTKLAHFAVCAVSPELTHTQPTFPPSYVHMMSWN